MTKKLLITALVVMISGCSSPPEPLPVRWDKPAQQINTTLQQWNPNNAVIASNMVNGHWSQYIASFSPDRIYSPAVWFAIAHSPEIVIVTNSGASYFNAKSWLQSNGSKALISFQNCFTCSRTDIYLYR
ncbi:Cag pathogenicity island protein Cag12 [Salmonella enterica]|nr:Cag pathogenicity island protein Cag12 [Salmonella enterica]